MRGGFRIWILLTVIHIIIIVIAGIGTKIVMVLR